MEPQSITATKTAFLRSQIRLLSAPLQLSSQWRVFLPEPEQGHLSDKVVQDVVSKANEKIKQHNRLVYSAQSQRHVAEQIETLYWQAVKAEDDVSDIDAVAVERRAELTATDAVRELPEDYEDLFLQGDRELDVQEIERYSELRAQLLELSARRDEAQQKLARYRRLQGLLSPYENAQENIQPNLVTRDGELAKELGKMRVLLARVTARMEEADGMPVDSMAARGVVLSNEQKLQHIMELG